jgi:uncharacterized protein YigE (DUF2233 family)
LTLRRLVLVLLAVAATVVAILFFTRGNDPESTQAPTSKSEGPEPPPVAHAEPCSVASFEQSQFIVCTVDPAKFEISLHHKDAAGKPWGDIKRFAASKRPVFAMNAGMYHDDLSPVGLYVERGEQRAPINVSDGAGNFFMKPNGVFGITADGKPFVVRSEIYALSKMSVSFATQSGPMLVIDGSIHPRFEPDGMSRNIRNGVGINVQGHAVFVISKDLVSFGKFARLFRDELRCQNALYFEGVVSAFAQSDSVVQGGTYPAGPIVAVFER